MYSWLLGSVKGCCEEGVGLPDFFGNCLVDLKADLVSVPTGLLGSHVGFEGAKLVPEVFVAHHVFDALWIAPASYSADSFLRRQLILLKVALHGGDQFVYLWVS